MSEVQLPLFAEPDIELAESVQDEDGRLTGPALVRRYGDRRNTHVEIRVQRVGSMYAQGFDIRIGTSCRRVAPRLKWGRFETADAAIQHATDRAANYLHNASRLPNDATADELLELIRQHQYSEQITEGE